ncbi:ABC transporter substrate-binding protein [Paenibacillus radicis (ex Xue et al. 2023)]|uniref:Extracellular solute-binding protein n=1 Tax=Paenibacillus radicis (ex Xue et al. 2023) TaxID=2972489 RepID=A0ABT1YA11_9BACL|nr:extracellular solute-binding protein [Paenibacillus radicis (ex Xue et al. 2023)]MCR8630034.1 extracellular solute-binding protein [Paenibacillus radicis (ex Xue et al. 2023)]
MRKKGKSIYLLSVIIILMLSGCTPGSTPSESSKSGEKGSPNPVTLEWWVNPSLGFVEENDIKQVITEYKKVAPHVTINYGIVPATSVDEKINVAIASDSFPDVYVDAINRLGPLYVRGITAELDSYMTDDYNYKEYLDSAKALMNIDGKIGLILMEIRSEVIMLNKDLFVKAGVQNLLPDAKTKAWSKDSFAKAAEAIGKLGNGVYGFGLAASEITNDKMIDGFIYADGDEYTNKERNKVTFNTPGNVKKLEWVTQQAKAPYTVPGTAGNKVPDLYELFKQGKIGIMTNDAGQYRSHTEAGIVPKTFEYMNAFYPTDDGSAGKLLINGSGIAVKKQENKVKEKEAANFALWFSNGKIDIVNKVVYQKASKLPTRKSLQSFIVDEHGKELLAMLEQGKGINNPVIIPNYQQIRKVWFNYYQPVMLNDGKVTAKDALAAYEKEAQKLLDEGNKQSKK